MKFEELSIEQQEQLLHLLFKMIEPITKLEEELHWIFYPIIETLIEPIKIFVDTLTDLFGGFDNIRIRTWWIQYKHLRGM